MVGIQFFRFNFSIISEIQFEKNIAFGLCRIEIKTVFQNSIKNPQPYQISEVFYYKKK